MQQRDAELFTQVCSYCWKLGMRISAFVDVSDPHGIGYSPMKFPGTDLDSLIELESMGLIQREIDGYSMDIPEIEVESESKLERGRFATVEYFGSEYILRVSDEGKELPAGIVMLTEAGTQLQSIAGAVPNQEYLEETLDRWRRSNIEVQPLPPAASKS